MITIFYKNYPYSPLATFLSICTSLFAMLFAVFAFVCILQKTLVYILVAILLAAAAAFLWLYVYRKLIDRLAEKWSDQNIRTKPRFAALFCRQHPEAYEEICSYNADFAQKYQMDDNGKLIKRKG